MKQKVVKVLLIFAVSTVLMVGSGCGSKGDLYLPQATQTADK
jgi:predicted small lipoprotein YifL